MALLFFLQPIVRGWARYQGRLNLGPTPRKAVESLASLSWQDRPEALDHVEYWSTTPLDRVDFVRRILERLDRDGWETKPDTGWNEFDLEILGSRWAHLQLVTVAEPHAKGRQRVRCRLRAAWSLSAKVALGLMFGFELVVIGLAGHSFWPILLFVLTVALTVPAFVWYVNRNRRDLQRLIAVVLDDIAQKNGMVKLNRDKPAAPKT